MKRSKYTLQRGFTLVEIAIVLLIIGLLIGGMLRGQELITSARVRNMIDQKSSLQAAMISFMDRYKMMAGDLTPQQASVVGHNAIASSWTGQGVNPYQGGGDGLLFWHVESYGLFQNLAVTGFISCGACAAGQSFSPVMPSNSNSPVNPYGNGVVVGNEWLNGPAFGVGNLYGAVRRTMLTTGAAPSQVLAELDRKADDGFPGTGSLRVTTVTNYSIGAGLPTAYTASISSCALGLTSATTNAQLSTIQWANPEFSFCSAAWLL